MKKLTFVLLLFLFTIPLYSQSQNEFTEQEFRQIHDSLWTTSFSENFNPDGTMLYYQHYQTLYKWDSCDDSTFVSFIRIDTIYPVKRYKGVVLRLEGSIRVKQEIGKDSVTILDVVEVIKMEIDKSNIVLFYVYDIYNTSKYNSDYWYFSSLAAGLNIKNKPCISNWKLLYVPPPPPLLEQPPITEVPEDDYR